MFTHIYRLSDPETGLYYQGDVPGSFGPTPIDYSSKKTAMAAYSAYIRYEMSLAKAKRPLRLKLHEIEVKLDEKGTDVLKPADVPSACARALFDKKTATLQSKTTARALFSHLLRNPGDGEAVCLMRLPSTQVAQARRDFQDTVVNSYSTWLAVSTWATVFSIRSLYHVNDMIDLDAFRAELETLGE